MKLSSVLIFAFVFVLTSVFVILLFVKKSGGFIAPTGIFLEVLRVGVATGKIIKESREWYYKP